MSLYRVQEIKITFSKNLGHIKFVKCLLRPFRYALHSSPLSKNIKMKMLCAEPVVLYRWKFWFVNLGKEYTLWVSEKREREMRKFGSKGDEVTGRWRKLWRGSLLVHLGRQNHGDEIGEAWISLELLKSAFRILVRTPNSDWETQA